MILLIGLTVILNIGIGVLCYLLYRGKRRYMTLVKDVDLRIAAAREQSVKTSKAVTRGQIAQEFIPLFPDFPYNLSDCKFSGQPIDYIVFEGMTQVRDGSQVEIQIVFADVKVNTAGKTKVQNAIKEAVEQKRIRFETWVIVDNVITIK